MSPRTVTGNLLRETPVLRTADTVVDAARRLLDCDFPALPVVDDRERLAGVFGEREFMAAVFPGYLGELKYAGFVRRSLDDALEKRSECGSERVDKHMTTEHVDVGREFSDMQVAEIFLHHRVLIVPVADGGRVLGVITRTDFFRTLAGRFLEVTG
jgi:CBS domain-containing protein